MDLLAILRQKSRPVYKLPGNHTVAEAIHLMNTAKVGALIVTQNEQPAGIFAERDVFRRCLQNNKTALSEIKLKNAMTDKLITAKPTDEIPALIAMMIKSDIKHLPVIMNKKIIGMLTLYDLIENQIKSLTEEIHQLKEYINDLHEAGRD